MTFYVGDVAEVSVTFKDRASVLANPQTVTAQVKPPGGVAVTYVGAPELTQTGVGLFVVRFKLNLPGVYRVSVLGQSADLALGVNASATRSFNVEPNGLE